MKDIVTSVQLVISSLGGCLGWFLGGTDGFLYALLFFIIVDYLTGVMVAILQHKVSSRVGFRGIFKKVVILCLVGIGHILDTNVVRSGNIMRTAIIFFYLSNEGISILENVAIIGLPVPKKLLDVLIALKSKNSEEVVDIEKIGEAIESEKEELEENKKEDKENVEKHIGENQNSEKQNLEKYIGEKQNLEKQYFGRYYGEKYKIEKHKREKHKREKHIGYRTEDNDEYKKYRKYKKD